jgi:hypothetical protein
MWHFDRLPPASWVSLRDQNISPLIFTSVALLFSFRISIVKAGQVFKLLGCIASQVNPYVKHNQRARRPAIGKAVSVPNGLAAHIGV